MFSRPQHRAGGCMNWGLLMRNHRLPAIALAGAFAAFLTSAAVTTASAREYNSGDRSWNGSSRTESTRRGSQSANDSRDYDGGRGNGGWNGGHDRDEGYGHRHHHWRGRYNPWWAYDNDRFDPPRWHRRHWWNRYY